MTIASSCVGTARASLCRSVYAVVALLVGCSDIVEPPPTIAVSVEAVEQTSIVSFSIGQRHVECEVLLEATARGSQGAYADLHTATLWLYEAANRSQLYTVLQYETQELGAMWGGLRIAAGQTRSAQLRFDAPEPVHVTGEIRYWPVGATQTEGAEFYFSCVPEGPVREGPAPWLAQIEISPSSGEVEVGRDRIRIGYYAESPAGLIETGVRVAGGLNLVESRQEFSDVASRTIDVELLHEVEIGTPLRFQLFARDAAGRERSSEWFDGPTPVDRTPPRIETMYLEGYASTSAPVRLVGRYGSQDTLRLRLWAGDNNGLSHLVYSLGPPANVRDSVAVPRFLLLHEPIEIPIRRDWIGKPQLTVYVRDRAGLKSEEYASPPDSLHILPDRAPVVRSVEIAGIHRDMAIDATRRRMYLALPFDDAMPSYPWNT